MTQETDTYNLPNWVEPDEQLKASLFTDGDFFIVFVSPDNTPRFYMRPVSIPYQWGMSSDPCHDDKAMAKGFDRILKRIMVDTSDAIFMVCDSYRSNMHIYDPTALAATGFSISYGSDRTVIHVDELFTENPAYD